MQCQTFIAYAPDWLEGQRSLEAETHLQACATCRSYIAELEAIAATAREVEAATPDPPERIWVALCGQLEDEGITQPAEVESAGWVKLWSEWARGVSGLFRRPALAAAYAAVLVAAFLMTGGQSSPNLSVSLPDLPPNWVSQLHNKLESGHVQAAGFVSARNPEVAATYRDNLELVDKFIALCEKTVREQPGNTVARDYLLSAYQQKAELLTTIMERGVGD
jgi:anti-sigma factor RsiW